MANYNRDVRDKLDSITVPLVGDELLHELKASMVLEPLFRNLFGNAGERIFVEEVPSINDTIVPLIEFYWDSETPQSLNARHTGAFIGRILLPPDLTKVSNINRRIAGAFQAFMNGKMYGIVDRVPGLIMLGAGTTFRYGRLLQKDGLTVPIIDMSIPFEFDLRLFQVQNEAHDYLGPLTGDEFPDIETYKLKVVSDEGEVILQEGDLVQES